ncbi:hypothetical protein NUW54_g5621 [Trametes sanguinea]|uniref:Uncharacterized protein n=1 Tax=Trametes sanguinea TaxID=158606 RepID=A0ACC1PWF7_9APHY|nr:hypothetical protein NUW54_g5621 [Trametes sanguinea]
MDLRAGTSASTPPNAIAPGMSTAISHKWESIYVASLPLTRTQNTIPEETPLIHCDGLPVLPNFSPWVWNSAGGGLNFFNAHAVIPDPSLYNSVMARAPEFESMGIRHGHACHWHRLLYSGLTPLSQALPTDIGAAMMYEMYHAWKHNSFLYEPLSADR